MNDFDDRAALEAARVIWGHWQAGTALAGLPERCRPRTRADGYAIQARLADVAGRGAIGWKIAATSAAGQAHINVSGPLAGRLYAGYTFEPGDAVTADFGALGRVSGRFGG